MGDKGQLILNINVSNSEIEGLSLIKTTLEKKYNIKVLLPLSGL